MGNIFDQFEPPPSGTKRTAAPPGGLFDDLIPAPQRRERLSFGPVPGDRAGLTADPGRGLRRPLGYPSAACEHGVMQFRVLAFLRDESNRVLLAWIGGGLGVAAGGLWAVFTFYVDHSKPPLAKSSLLVTVMRPTVSAFRCFQTNSSGLRSGA